MMTVRQLTARNSNDKNVSAAVTPQDILAAIIIQTLAVDDARSHKLAQVAITLMLQRCKTMQT